MVDEANHVHVQSIPTTGADESDPEMTLSTSPSSNIVLKGYLSKWTNYIHGWQPRYMMLQDKTLSYCEYF